MTNIVKFMKIFSSTVRRESRTWLLFILYRLNGVGDDPHSGREGRERETPKGGIQKEDSNEL